MASNVSSLSNVSITPETSTAAVDLPAGRDIVAQVITLLIFVILGTTENILVITSIILHASGSIRSVHLQLVINLCVVDLLTITTCLPVPLLMVQDAILPPSDLVCRLTSWLSLTLYAVHNITLLLILLDRLMATKLPTWYFQRVKAPSTRTAVILTITGTWACSALLSSGTFSFSIRVEFDQLRMFCIPDFSRPLQIVSALVLLLMTLAMAVGYTSMYLALKSRRSVQILTMAPSPPTNAMSKKEAGLGANAALVTCVATVVYLLLWVPFWVLLVWVDGADPGAVVATTWLVYASTCINPLLYGGFNHNIRKGIVKIGHAICQKCVK